jgi:hypothetical protein
MIDDDKPGGHDDLTKVCQQAMKDDPAAVFLVRGYPTGMLQLQAAVKKLLGGKCDKAMEKAVRARLYRLCLPAFWSADEYDRLQAEDATGAEIAKVLRKALTDYCEHGRSTSSSCLACESWPGVGLLEDDAD